MGNVKQRALRLRAGTWLRLKGTRGSLVALCAIVAACSGPTAPGLSYSGQWAGVTAQGESITFTISPDQLVTAITLGYAFNGCRGSQTFANLNVSIVPQVTCVPGPCPGSLSSYREFSYQAGNSAQEPMTQVNGVIFADAGARGTIDFRNYPDCGSAIGVAWNATRH